MRARIENVFRVSPDTFWNVLFFDAEYNARLYKELGFITVDVTDVSEVAPGDEVVILGRQGDEIWQQIDAREVAAAIGTIPWEIVCRLGTRIERHYDGSND